jgi:hypothetical protein
MVSLTNEPAVAYYKFCVEQQGKKGGSCDMTNGANVAARPHAHIDT